MCRDIPQSSTGTCRSNEMKSIDHAGVRDTAFIVSQPLQILIAISIIRQKRSEKKSCLIIVGTFFDAHQIFERMKLIDWEMGGIFIVFFDSHEEAHLYIKENEFDNLFTDGDVGVRKYRDLLLMKASRRSLKINVYEEGLGTYRPDLYSGAKKLILNLLGVGTNFGGCSLTSSLYVLDPDSYRKIFPRYRCDVKKIDLSPMDIIKLYFNELSHIFGHCAVAPKSFGVCHIYLSGWSIDFDFLHKFSNLPGDKYIKLHPRVKLDVDENWGTRISRSVPAEMVLIDLKEKYNEVNVYHHGSSAERYFNENDVVFIRI